MDKAARGRLLAEISRQETSGGEVAVPLELFFDGNDDRGSIGCNLGRDQPPISEFHRVLARLRAKPEVLDVLARITDVGDESTWPFTDTVYVISSLSQADVESALKDLRFDEVTCGWLYGKPVAATEPAAGFSVYSVWWD